MESNAQVWFAFPGLGKTTIAKERAGFVDLDFGYFREAFRTSKENEHELFEPFTRLIKLYVNSGLRVMTNEPGLIPFVKQMGFTISMFIPSNYLVTADRIEKRGDTTFAQNMRIKGAKWIDGWRTKAEKYNIDLHVEELEH